ncbi:helix-turn-helix domain-containing protein [Pectinatus frisingensis]|uniref:helix-turn-helix domain-containing protein n=1 Tax=Pectinatus frisingensis TaxID=865 RepID=UPI0018C77CE3|nr:helix-turn-helix transcriptional regulator [Pectinatus frisingensis]
MNTRILERRKALKLTQLELEKETGISQSMLSRVECGKRRLDDTHKIALAKALKTNVGWLFFNENYGVTS